jgi:hypothetical protein
MRLLEGVGDGMIIRLLTKGWGLVVMNDGRCDFAHSLQDTRNENNCFNRSPCWVRFGRAAQNVNTGFLYIYAEEKK